MMKLTEEHIKLLEAIHEQQDFSEFRQKLNWTLNLFKYYAEELQKYGYLEIYAHRGGRTYSLTNKGKVALENPDKVRNDSSMGMNNSNISGSINAPIGEFFQNSNQNTVNLQHNIITIDYINHLFQEIQNLPKTEKKLAIIYLEDLKTEVEKGEQSDPERVKAYWFAFSGVFLPYLDQMSNIADVIEVIKKLDNKLEIELPTLEKITNRSQLTEEQVNSLANEIDQVVWSRLKSKFIK